MSYLEKLLEGVEVQWENFGEVAKIQRGASPRPIAKFITDDKNGVPWIKIGDTVPNSKYVNKTKQKITFEGAKKSRILKKGDLIMSNSMSYGRPYILKINGAIHDGWASISDFGDKLNSDYLFLYLTSEIVQDYWLSKINSSSVSNLNADIIKSLQIPIPPLKVQKEIVRILEVFTKQTTDLTAELTTELNARKNQYWYYREQLFSFEESEVEWKSLNEIGEFQRGKRFVRTDLISEGVPTIHYGEMYTHYGTWADETKSFVSKELVEKKKLRVAKKGDIVIVAAGETIEDIGKGTAWLGDEGVVIHDACFSYRSPLHPKYVAYFTRTKQFHDQIRRHISSGKISAINSKGLSKVIIPVPSKEEQERIVSILDKFDTLTHSISESLPKEIELRKKQYKYYRDMLLTFPQQEPA
ncbi:restriction endonuclease subunit S [Salinimicrobium xinjiangense]|uniref:restriction endonuclease subunit S n=1 Tax=Salinimicrobium xinjiangense TaxID=438596 RepID=UPI000424CDD9|nr:restriction endonuclease subunit S [Salinimicrobium xinjiangense]